jgi:hypothetical protein
MSNYQYEVRILPAGNFLLPEGVFRQFDVIVNKPSGMANHGLVTFIDSDGHEIKDHPVFYPELNWAGKTKSQDEQEIQGLILERLNTAFKIPADKVNISVVRRQH